MFESDECGWAGIHGFDEGCSKTRLVDRIDRCAEAEESDDVHSQAAVREVEVDGGVGS